MMGGGAFILLKAGRPWPESAKQAEIRLAILLKILPIGREPFATDGRHPMVVLPQFAQDMANLTGIVRFVI